MSLLDIAREQGALLGRITTRGQAERAGWTHGLAALRLSDRHERRLASGDFAVFVPERWRRLYMRAFMRAAGVEDVVIQNDYYAIKQTPITWVEATAGQADGALAL